MKKSGKIILAGACVYVLFYLLLNLNNKNINKEVTVTQYENRIKEFCIFDTDQSVKQFYKFLELGINPSDAFYMTISKTMYV
jgi:hypothetical protein